MKFFTFSTLALLLSFSASAKTDIIYKKLVSGGSNTCTEANRKLDKELDQYKNNSLVVKIEIDGCKYGPIPWDDDKEQSVWQNATVYLKINNVSEAQ